MKITVTDEFDGKTVGVVLRANGASGTLIKLLKSRPHGITVAGADVTVRYTVNTGDVIDIDDGDTYDDENEYIFPSDDKIDILYEDNNVFVLNKPSGMPTHTSHGHYADTLANALCAEYRRRGLPFVFRAVNRLDADTSGAVLIAKSKLSACMLARHMEAGRIGKTYIAALDGEMSSPVGETLIIRSYIRRRSETIILRESIPITVDGDIAGCDYAETVYKCLYKGEGHTIVAATPVTGRTHQLRVHFSSLGYPISGDDLYGGVRDEISRQALHAYKLEFPSSRGQITVTAPLPEDIRKMITKHIDIL